MDIKELLHGNIGDLKVKKLLYETALISHKEHADKIKRYISELDGEISMLQNELTKRTEKEVKKDVREQKRKGK